MGKSSSNLSNFSRDYPRVIIGGVFYIKLYIQPLTHNSLIFPEAFLWHVFRSLATALTYCALGHTASAERLPDWEEIVHCDLKPGNILVGAPDPVINKHYPTIKMADFGLAYTIPTGRDDIRRYKSNWGAGTPNWRAPEVQQIVDGYTGMTPYALHGSHSDVWAVGKIMAEMCSLVWDHYPESQIDAFNREERWAIKAHVYSRQLFGWINRCMRPDGRRRPSPWRLLQATEAEAGPRKEALDFNERRTAIGTKHGLYDGQMLMEKKDRDLFTDNSEYRQAYIDMNLDQLYAGIVQTVGDEIDDDAGGIFGPEQAGNVAGEGDDAGGDDGGEQPQDNAGEGDDAEGDDGPEQPQNPAPEVGYPGGGGRYVVLEDDADEEVRTSAMRRYMALRDAIDINDSRNWA